MSAGPLTLEDLERLEADARADHGWHPDTHMAAAIGGYQGDVLRLTAALRSVMAEWDAIRRARDEVKAAGEAVAPRNDPVARESVWNRMRAAEKALRDLVEAL